MLKSLRFSYFNEQVKRRLGQSLLDLPSKWFRTKSGDPTGHQSKWKEGIFPTARTILRLIGLLGDLRFIYAHPMFHFLAKHKMTISELRTLACGEISTFLVDRHGKTDGGGYIDGTFETMDRCAQHLAAIVLAQHQRDIDRFEKSWNELSLVLPELIGSSEILMHQRRQLQSQIINRYSSFPSERVGIYVSYWFLETLSIEAFCGNFGWYRDTDSFKKSRFFCRPRLGLCEDGPQGPVNSAHPADKWFWSDNEV